MTTSECRWRTYSLTRISDDQLLNLLPLDGLPQAFLHLDQHDSPVDLILLLRVSMGESKKWREMCFLTLMRRKLGIRKMIFGRSSSWRRRRRGEMLPTTGRRCCTKRVLADGAMSALCCGGVVVGVVGGLWGCLKKCGGCGQYFPIV